MNEALNEDNLTPYGEPLPVEYETLDRKELKSRLSAFIEEMLDTNFEKLCSMIYRHDVEESKFSDALQEGTVAEQAAQIADLVIDRELQKVASRKAYRKEKEERNKKESGSSLKEEW